MYELHTITSDSIPKCLHGIEGSCGLRPLSLDERLSIEDHFFTQRRERKIFRAATTLILPDATRNPGALEEFATLSECAMSLLASHGHPSFSIVALFSSGDCISAKHLGRGLGR
jgi:hypothetical protein